jgi:uncharacterized membrane protein
MEKQTLPNSTLILVLGILSIIGCCCYGLPGIILGIIAIVLSSGATKIYMEAPENYSGFGNVKAGKIMGIIAIALSIIFLIFILWVITIFGWENLQNEEMIQEKIQEMMGQ